MRGVFAHLPMAGDGQVLVNLGLIHRDNEVIPYWDGWLELDAHRGWRRFAWYVWDQGPGMPGDWKAASRRASSSSSTSTREPQAEQDRALQARRPGNRTCAPMVVHGDARQGWRGRRLDHGPADAGHRIPDSVIRVMRHKGKIGQDIDHPAVFLVALPEFVIEAYTDRRHRVRTLRRQRARCWRPKRTAAICRSVEIAPEYVDVAIKALPAEPPWVPVTLIGTVSPSSRSPQRNHRLAEVMVANWLADKIEQWPTDPVAAYARNARTHSRSRWPRSPPASSSSGSPIPILAGSDGVIVAGHGRPLPPEAGPGTGAGRRARPSDATPARRAWSSRTTASPRTPAGTMRCCASNWKPAARWLRSGHHRLRRRCAGRTDGGRRAGQRGQTDEDAVPEVSETPISRPGDVWIMGQHRLLCGDSTVAESYDLLMPATVVDMVFTDPPYNVNYANSAKDKMRGKDRAILNDNLGDGFYDFLLAALTPTVAHCRGGSTWRCRPANWMCCRLPFALPVASGRPSSSGPRTPLPLGRADYQRQYEPIPTDGPRATRHWCGDRDQGDVWNIKKPQKNDLHPTMKPVGWSSGRSAIRAAPATWCSIPSAVRHDADRGGKVRPRCAADRTRSQVRGRDRAPVGGLHRSRPPARRMARCARSGGERSSTISQ